MRVGSQVISVAGVCRNFVRRTALLGISILAGLAASASRADQITGWDTRLGDWTFIAAFDDDGIRGYLAVCNPAVPVGDNIRMIWFPTGGEPAGWASGSVGEAIAWINETQQLQSGWHVSAGGPAATMAAPVAMSFGLLESDPLVEFVASDADPIGTVEAIAEIGLGAAPMLSSMAAREDSGGEFEGTFTSLRLSQVVALVSRNAEIAIIGETTTPPIDDADYFCAGCTHTSTRSYGTWTCAKTTVGSATHCTCTGTEFEFHAYTGLEIFGCDPCPPSNYTLTRPVLGDTTILPEDPCPTPGGPATIVPTGPWS